MASNLGCLVSIEAVYLLVNFQGQSFWKQLAPDLKENKRSPTSKTAVLHPFIDRICLIEFSTIQVVVDFRICCYRKNNANVTVAKRNEINLLFHEYLLEKGIPRRFYVENMGNFELSKAKEAYRYFTTPLKLHSSTSDIFSMRRRTMRLEIFDVGGTAWFVGEWPIKMAAPNSSSAQEWLYSNLKVASSGPAAIDNDGEDYESLNDDDFVASNGLKRKSQSHEDFSVVSLPTSRELVPNAIEDSVSLDGRSRSHPPISISKPSSSSIIQSRPLNSPLSHGSSTSSNDFSLESPSLSHPNSSNASFEASFEDLNLEDFQGLSDSKESEEFLKLPRGSSPKARERYLVEDTVANDRNSLPSSRAESPAVAETSPDLRTVNILQQVGNLLISNSWGQLVTSTIKPDRSGESIRTSYTTSAIHLLGVKYRLQGLLSNVLLMETEAVGMEEETKASSPDPVEEDFECDEESCSKSFLERTNQFSNLAKRLSSPNGTGSRYISLREVLALYRSGPKMTRSLKVWFESFGWIVRGFNDAILQLQSPPIWQDLFNVEIRVYHLTSASTSATQPAAPELFLVELLVSVVPNMHVGSDSNSSVFKTAAQANAFFVELAAFIVQLELNCDAGESANMTVVAPELVLLEAWNAHLRSDAISQSENIPIVKFSAIPSSTSFSSSIYFWSEHLQAWLLQRIHIQGARLTLHPLIDFSSSVEIALLGCHLTAAQDENERVGTFTLVSAQGQAFHFRTLHISDLKEVIGRIRFTLLSTNSSSKPRRERPNSSSSVLQADQIYRGAESNSKAAEVFFGVNAEDSERVRSQNLSVMDAFLEDFQSRFWFTYRRGFERIEPSLFTSDLGWGCMLRTGQSLMAEAMARFYFGRNWRLWRVQQESSELQSAFGSPSDSLKMNSMTRIHSHIISNFFDSPSAPYSIHQLAKHGAKIGRPIGQWFGPSILGNVLKNITNSLKDSPFWVYLSPDGSFPTEHLLKIVSKRAVLILLPLRLGIDELNPIYAHFIRGTLRLPVSLGIVGGKPDKSLYFVGYQDWDLFYLDPHTLKVYQPRLLTDPFALKADFHCQDIRSCSLESIDPSMLFGFLCCSGEEVVQLRDQLHKLNRIANILTIKS